MSFNQQPSRIFKQDTPLRSVCCLLPVHYTEKGTLNRQKRQRSHYMALLGIILKIYFLCSSFPSPYYSVFFFYSGYYSEGF